MTALRFDRVTKRFGRFDRQVVALDDVSLELGDHEVLALVGPSGCGKSTLLRAIAGIHPIDEGSIRLGDRVVDDGRNQMPPEKRRVGLVFQEHALFPHLSVADNVAFGVRDDTATVRSAEMLDLVGMTEYAERYPHELSGGERQRVALARALAPNPDLMLLDEPFASLDTNLRARVRDDVVAILRSTRTPAVFVTHDQHDALAVGDRIAVMRSGQVVQVGAPDAVFHRPVDRFVASFMGEASYVPLAEAADVDGLAGALTGDLVGDRAGADRTLMLRPDDIVLEHGDGAVVEHAEFRGTVWCYTVRLPHGAAVKSLRNHLEPVQVGSSVRARLRPGHHPVVLDA